MSSAVQLEVHHVRFFEYQPLAINCIAFDASTQKVAVSRSDGSLQILSTADNWFQELSFPGGDDSSVEALVWCHQRLFAAGLGGNVVEFDLDTQLAKDSVSSNAGPIWCLTKNQDEDRLAAGTEDGCVVLFSVEEELQFLRFFGKQEGRILSIAWFTGPDQENIIITGGANNIRHWSINSGQPVSRMTLGSCGNKDTIVWCLTVTKDFTIISGDSRGVVTFWNGRLSTQMKSFHCHKADVLCMCLSADEKMVYTGGVDAGIYQFTCCSSDPNSDRKRWIHQLLHSYHTHDVRAIAYTEGSVTSGGVDSVLHVARLGKIKQVRAISPFPSTILVDIDKEHKLVLLQYRKYLELWRLGEANIPKKQVQGIIPLTQNPVKLIQLKAREGQEVICSALSPKGQLAFSDQQHVRLYRFDVAKAKDLKPQPKLERLPHSFSQPARLLTFSPSGDFLIATLVGSALEVMDTKTGKILHRVTTDSTVHLLTASPDNQHFAYATLKQDVCIRDIPSGKMVCQCPLTTSQVSALSFSPHNKNLFIAYSNHKVYEMDINLKEYSPWCRQQSQEMPINWLQSFKTIKAIVFHPKNNHFIYLYTEACLALLDRREPTTDTQGGIVARLARKCFKYKYLLHADFLEDGKLVVIERPPSMIDELLPVSLKQKKFGVA